MGRREPKFVKVEFKGGQLLCHLPLTKPTGKVRVRRGLSPLPTRQEPLKGGDFVEWQISYFGPQGELVELGALLKLALKHGLIERGRLLCLKGQAEKVDSFFDERWAIEEERGRESFWGYEVLHRKHPLLRKEVGGISIEIELRHKQRAVGYQPMLFLLIPVGQLKPSPVGRTAKPNEVAEWAVEVDILLEVVRGFAIASRGHRKDMLELLGKLVGEG